LQRPPIQGSRLKRGGSSINQDFNGLIFFNTNRSVCIKYCLFY
jgi:hypothetical protein